jgi:hypothetical protein
MGIVRTKFNRNLFACLLALLTVGTVSNAEAQLFKKMFGKKSSTKHHSKDADESDSRETRKQRKKHRKEERRKEKEERRKEQKRNNKKKSTKRTRESSFDVPKRRHNITYAATQMKSRYRVDLLASMYLDELVKDGAPVHKDKLPEKASAGVAFYQGVKLAADSLRKAGMNLDIYVHDVTAGGQTSDELVNTHKLDSTDLIFAAVQQKDITTLSAFAKRKKVNLVSVLSPATAGVKDNPYFTLIQPSLKTNCEWIAGDVAKKFLNNNVVVFHRSSVQADENAYRYFTDEAEGEIELTELRCNVLPTKAQLLAVFDTSKPSIVVMPILDAEYGERLLKLLSASFPGTHFEIYGMPTWSAIDDLRKPMALRNLTVNITQPFNFESAELTKRIDAEFKRQYVGAPSELVYRGYETMLWYAALLKENGTIFNNAYNSNTGVGMTQYKIMPVWDNHGNMLHHENAHVYFTTYEAGRMSTSE